MANNDFTVKKDAEFFISIAQQGHHTFMMLGVIDDSGLPRLLARIAKTHDVDPDFNKEFKVGMKATFSQTLARIADEGISRNAEHSVTINYQAYVITYDQVQAYLAMIQEIENKQNDDSIIKSRLKIMENERVNTYKKDNPTWTDEKLRDYVKKELRIRCYLPKLDATSNAITFHFQSLYENLFSANLQPDEKKEEITKKLVKDAKHISARNTCRTNAIAIIEAILGFPTSIPNFFLFKPKHKTNLCAGQPVNPFYLLPNPPEMFEKPTNELRVLQEIYNRLESIPSIMHHTDATQKKFTDLKALYNELAGPNKKNSSKDLLAHILKYEIDNAHLFTHRNKGFLNASGQTATKKMFNRIEHLLKKADEKENTLYIAKK